MTESSDLCPIHDGPATSAPQSAVVAVQGQGLSGPEAPPPNYHGPRPSSDSVLISATGRAHRLGACANLPDYVYLVPPKWGWINDPSVWQRIGVHEIRAREGNLDRVATRRCLDCDESS